MDINTDRVCENCGCDWRGSEECPVCMHINIPDEPETPFAVFAYDWPEVGRMFTVFGGPLHRSTVTAETLVRMGVEVPR